ncbi:MAG: type VI secretion system baseplate subunit TssE [Myxococcota bacterium]
MAGSFFLRLEKAADPTSAARSVYRGEDLEAAVVQHLRELLNTRAGSVPTVPDYGMIDVADLVHEMPDALAIVQRGIKNSIAKYEPRLKNVQVRLVPTEEDESVGFIHFEVNAQLVQKDGRRQAVQFSTRVDNASNVKVT